MQPSMAISGADDLYSQGGWAPRVGAEGDEEVAGVVGTNSFPFRCDLEEAVEG